MPPANTIAHWQSEISQHLPHLSRPQAAVLALWSYGIVLTKSCGITTVVAFLACLLGWSQGNLRQRLRECWAISYVRVCYCSYRFPR